MSASAFARAFNDSIWTRSLFVKAVPAPLTSHERRAVLRVLQSYGEIEVFKKLENSSAFISVTSDKKTAMNLLMRKTPLEYALAPPESNTSASFLSSNLAGGFRKTIVHNVEPVRIHSNSNSDLDTNAQGVKTFTLHVFPVTQAKQYDHKGKVEQNALHGPWPMEGIQETFVSTALKNSIPPGVWGPGLRDWHTSSEWSAIHKGPADEGAEGLVGKNRVRKATAYAQDRVRRQKEAKKLPPAMRGLKALTNSQSHGSPDTTTDSGSPREQLGSGLSGESNG